MAQDPSKDRLKGLSPSPLLTLHPNTHEPIAVRPLLVPKGKQRRRTSQKTVTPTLLELPYEVRHRILQFLLSTDIEENHWTSYEHNCTLIHDRYKIDNRRFLTLINMPEDFLPSHSAIMEGYKLYPNILWTSKQFLGEGTKVLVEENKYIAIRYPATYAPMITTFMMQSGIHTFWVEPGVFKSPTTEHGRPVVAIEVVSTDSRDHASILVIVPLVNLGSLCQALGGLKACIIKRDRTAFRALRVNLEVSISSIPAWKKRGFISVVDYLKCNLLDWIGDSVDQITFSGLNTGLKLENNLRSWLQRQSNTFSIKRSPIDYKNTMHRFVCRFRKAEKQFLSNDFMAACASFMELNGLLAFSFFAFQLENRNWGVQFLELSDWVHFYLGMSFLETARGAEDTRVYDHDELYHQLVAAGAYFPNITMFAKWGTLTPGHEVASRLAKAELACVSAVTRNRAYICKRYLKKALRIMEMESTTSDCGKIREMCFAPSFTIAMFQQSRKEINRLMLEIFGPLTPVKLQGDGK